ncbi:MAG: FAD-dependent oxidoreductase [Bacteroidota bacterium]
MHLLLVGGGHASLPLVTAAGRLVRRGARVTLLNDTQRLWYSGMVPEHLGGVYTRTQVTIDLARLCAEHGVAFVEERVVGLDAAAQTFTTESGRTFACDLAAVDIGAVNPSRPTERDAIATKPLHRIEALAALLDTIEAEGAAQRLVIVGGGAAGVEVALNVTARLPKSRLDVTLIEPSHRLLGRMPEGAAAYCRRLLTERGVRIRFGQRVEAVTEAGVTLSGGAQIESDAVLWATGSVGPPLFAEAGLPTNRRGFLRVNAHLQCEAAPWLFAAGDCAVIDGAEHLARVGVHAVKQGPTLRTNLLRIAEAMLDGRDLARLRLDRFRPYPLVPLILSTGTSAGLTIVGDRWQANPTMLRLKHAVDRRWIRRYHPEDRFDGLLDTAHSERQKA